MINDEGNINEISNKYKEISDTTNITNTSNFNRTVFNSEKFDPIKYPQGKGKKINKKSFMNIINLEGVEENINLIRTKYFEKGENLLKAEEFREKYHKFLNGGYLDLLLLMKEYPDFNIFDYINADMSLYHDEGTKTKLLRKKMLTQQNNLFLRVLIEASQFYNNYKNNMILDDMSFLKPHIDIFKNMMCEREKSDTLEIDVEVFFLSILGYKEKAKTIVVKFYDYFKKFMRDFSDSDFQTKIIFENLDTISDKDYIDLSDTELIVLRKIINNCIKRKFYRGIEFLCQNEIFCLVMTEGRIWKSVIKYLSTIQVLNIWDSYYAIISNNNKQVRSTIHEEYAKKLAMLNSDDPKLKIEKKEREIELSLDFVVDFKSFLITIFKFNKNDVAMEAINHVHEKNKNLINLEIFEVCLEYDEDISIELLEKAINSENAQDYHMKLSLMKKYFRLACKLLKFKICKAFLNIPRPKDDNEDYVFIMNRFQLQEKQKIYEKLEKEGLKAAGDKSENNQNYFKLLSIFSEDDDIHKLEDETIKENMNHDEKAGALMENSLVVRRKFGSILIGPNDLHKENSEIYPKKLGLLDPKNFNNNEIIKDPSITSLSKFHQTSQLLNEKDDNNNPLRIDVLRKTDSISQVGYKSIIEKMSGIIKKKSSEIINTPNQEYDNRSLFNPDRDKTPNVNINLNSFHDKRSEESPQEVEMINFIRKRSTPKIPGIQIDYAEAIPIAPEKENDPTKFNLKSRRKSIVSEMHSDVEGSININSKRQERRGSTILPPMQSQAGSERKEKTSLTMNFKDLMESKTPINVQMILIDHLRWGQYTFYCICLLSSVSERYLNTEYSEKICKSLMVFSRDEEAISRCRNPLILCVLTAEFLIKLGKLNSKYQYKCQSIAEMFLKLGECLQASIKDEEMLNYYLREQIDHKKRSALEIIAENRFYDLLNDENVATIVGKLWYGSGRDLSIFKFSRISRIMMANIKHEHYKDLVTTDGKNKFYSFQYSQYTRNCSVRYLVDSVSTIMTTILYQLIIYFYVSISSRDQDPNEDYFFRNINYIANIIVFTINLNLLMYLFYVYLTNRTLKMTVFIFLDLLMFIGVLLNFVKIPYLMYGDDIDSIQFLDAIIYSVIILCAWMRVIGILMTTRSFGPFLRIIYLLLSTVFNFLFVFFGLNTVFAQVFTILFRNTNDDFKGFFSSWISLFNSSFGIQDFTHFTIMKVFGYILLMAYTTGTNIILLNLVVAIINNLFHYFEKKADAENRAVLVLSYERIKWDEEYGLMILLPAPFNIISLFFTLILIFVKDKHRNNLNTKFSKICYFIIALGNFFTLLLSSIILFPFAYIKSLIHSAYDNISKISVKTLPYVFFHITTRPFTFLFYIIEDVKNFWALCYTDNLLENKELKRSLVNRDIIMSIRKVLFNYRFDQKKKIISVEELNNRLGLNKKRKNLNYAGKSLSNPSEITDSSNEGEGSESDNGSDLNKSGSVDQNGRSHDEFSNSHLSHRSETNPVTSPTNENAKHYARISFTDFNNLRGDMPLTSQEKSLAFRYLVDKIVDKDGFIDIERTLFILPSRVKYTDHFIRSLNFLNMRVILRGLQKYFFLNAANNPIYSYKKLQQLIYKIIIKFKMIYSFLPDNQMNQLKSDFKVVNIDERFSKSYDNLVKMEQNDEFSDYDDQGIFEELSKIPNRISSKKVVGNNNNTNQSQETPSAAEDLSLAQIN